jgi:competence protein ComEA
MNVSLRRWGAALLVGLVLVLPAMVSAQNLVNINTASSDELQTLPGIGRTKAAAIIEYRQQNGPFTSIDQLTDVSGIGAGTLANIRDLVTLGDGGSASPRAPAEFDDEPVVDLRDDGPSVGEPVGVVSADDRPASPSTAPAGLVNVNTASSDELQTLPGIGPAKAAAIIEYRQRNGPFRTIDQLDDVSGIGPATLNNIRALVTLD